MATSITLVMLIENIYILEDRICFLRCFANSYPKKKIYTLQGFKKKENFLRIFYPKGVILNQIMIKVKVVNK